MIRLMLMLALVTATSACAQPDDGNTEAELEAVVEQAPKKHYPELIKFNERKLERVFQAQLASADDELKAALMKSQAEWREFYEAECLVGAIQNRGGSGSYPSTAGRRLHILRARIHQLAVPYAAGWPEIPTVAEPEK